MFNEKSAVDSNEFGYWCQVIYHVTWLSISTNHMNFQSSNDVMTLKEIKVLKSYVRSVWTITLFTLHCYRIRFEDREPDKSLGHGRTRVFFNHVRFKESNWQS